MRPARRRSVVAQIPPTSPSGIERYREQAILLIVRTASQAEAPTRNDVTEASRVGSLAVGGVAGFSSGLLGIGGGLAILVCNYPNTRLS